MVSAGLLVLGWFKYFNFFASSLRPVLHAIGMGSDSLALDILLPVGISFYTFHTISYVVDVYRRKMPCEMSLIQFAEFVAIWPVLKQLAIVPR